MANSSEKVFPSLQECLSHICKTCGITQTRCPDGDHDPAWLFRGEPNCYPHTSCGMYRLITRNHAEDGKTAFFDDVIAAMVDFEGIYLEQFEDELGPEAAGFLQHYGVPTDLLDFACSLTVAASFAFDGGKQMENDGAIAVVERSRLSSFCDLLDLRKSRCERPRRQHAWAVRHRAGHATDFKHGPTVEDLGIRWYRFKKTPNDRSICCDLAQLYDTSTDSGAADMVLLLDVFVRDFLNNLTNTPSVRDQIARIRGHLVRASA